MSIIHKGLTTIAMTGVLLAAGGHAPPASSPDESLQASAGRSRGVKLPGPSEVAYKASDLEYYLDEDGIVWIRPGLNIQVVSVTNVAPGQRPVVEVRFTDDRGQPLDRLGRVTPGVISASMVLAVYNGDTRLYTAYTVRTQTSPPSSPNPGVSAIQAAADSGGTWTDFETGRSRYTFRTAVPANADLSKTHSVAIYASRNLVDIIDKTYYDNVVHDFRPDGAPITEQWAKISDAACNTCHEQLALHGGSRRDVKLCATCHSPQTTDPDTGNTVDLAVMVHKIHRGENLPSVEAGMPYQIIGFQGSVHDYSHVVYPQDIRNCENCHEVGNPAQKEVWFTEPSRRACGSCHDDINWVTGEGHAAGPQLNDNACANCHVPDSGVEFDASVKGAHTVPYKSKQLAGLKVSVVSVTNLKPGERATVVFKITNNDGTAVDGSKLNAFAPMLAGPTSSYRKTIREAAPARAVFDPATGNTTFTFNAAVPTDATGTWGVSGDFYRNVTIKRADGEPDIAIREAAFNPIRYVAVTGSLEPRRLVATTSNCNNCHDRLALHGQQRLNVEECVMCHNPVADDSGRRPADQNPPESISMQRMIHRIHSGVNLTQDFTVYGFGNTRHNYNQVGYPQDRRNCDACHVSNSHLLPIPSGDPVITLRDYFTPQGPGTAACLGCHDTIDAAAHAFLNTTNFGTRTAESCAVCHGTNKTWSVEKSHAR